MQAAAVANHSGFGDLVHEGKALRHPAEGNNAAHRVPISGIFLARWGKGRWWLPANAAVGSRVLTRPGGGDMQVRQRFLLFSKRLEFSWKASSLIGFHPT